MSADLMVGIGVPLGIHSGTDTAPEDAHGVVRLAGSFVHLPLPLYRLWHAARGLEGTGGLVSWATADGLELTPADVAQLEELRVLARLPVEGPGALYAVRTLRLIPMAVCLGNSQERPTRYDIALTSGEVLLAIGAPTYLIWAHSDGTVTVAQAIEYAAAQLSVPGEDACRDFLRDLPQLLLLGAAFLDGTKV